MNDVQIFQFAASGRWNNIGLILTWIFVLVVDAFCIRYVVRTTKELRRKTDQRAEWKSAAHTAVEIAQTIFFAVLAGLSGGG